MASSIFDIAAQAMEGDLNYATPLPLSAPKPAPITPAPTFRTLLDNAVINIPNSKVDWSTWETRGMVPPLEAAESLRQFEDKLGPLETWDRDTLKALEPDITSVSEYYRRMTKNDEGQSQGMLDYLDDVEAFGQINRFTDRVFDVDATGNKTIKPEAFEKLDLDRRTKDLLALTQDYEQNPNAQMGRDALIRHIPLFGEMLQSMDAGEAIKGPRLLKKFEEGTITDGETRELARIMAWNRTIARSNEDSPTYRRMMAVQRTLGEALVFGTGAGALSKMATTNLGKTAMIALGAPVFSPRAYSDVINRYASGDSFSTALTDGYVTSAIESGVEFWGGKLIGKSFEKIGQLFKGKPTKAAVQSGLSKWMESTGLGKLSASGITGELLEERLQEVVGGYAAMVSGRDWGDTTMGVTGAALRNDMQPEHWEQLLVETLSIGTMMGAGHLANRSDQKRRDDFNAKTQFLFDNLDKFPALQKEFASPEPYSRRKGPEMFKAVGLPNTTKEYREAVREKANRLVAGEAGPLEKLAGKTREELGDEYFQQMQVESGPAVTPPAAGKTQEQSPVTPAAQPAPPQPVDVPPVAPVQPTVTQPEAEWPEPTFKVAPVHKDLAAEFPVLPPNAVYAILDEEKRMAEEGYEEFDRPRREWLIDRLNAGTKPKDRTAAFRKFVDLVQSRETDHASIPGFDLIAAGYESHFYGDNTASPSEGSQRTWDEIGQIAARNSTFGWQNPDLIERTRKRLREMLERGDFDNRPIAEDPDYAPEPGMPFDRVLRAQADPNNFLETLPGDQRAEAGLKRLRPDAAGQPVRVFQGILLDKSNRNKGRGQWMILNELAQNPEHWYWNSQAFDPLAKSLSRLKDDGLIELEIRLRQGGEFTAKITEKGKQYVEKRRQGVFDQTTKELQSVRSELDALLDKVEAGNERLERTLRDNRRVFESVNELPPEAFKLGGEGYRILSENGVHGKTINTIRQEMEAGEKLKPQLAPLQEKWRTLSEQARELGMRQVDINKGIDTLPDEPPILQDATDLPPWERPPTYRQAETPSGDFAQPIPTDLLVATLRQLGVAIESGKLKGARGQYDIANIQVIIDRESTTDPDQFRKTLAHELAHAIDYFEFDDWVKQFGHPKGAAGLPAILNAVEIIKKFVTSSKLLAKNNDVRLGLIAFSENWRGPWDRNDKEMHKYRSDVRELWADYVGAMLISPQDAADGAPIVWEKLFEQLFEPQNAKALKAYQQMQAIMTSTKSYTDAMLKVYRDSRIDAREKALRMKAMEDAEVAKNDWGWTERVYNALFDSKGLIRRKVDAIGGEEEFNLLSSQYDSIMSDYHRTIREQVYKPINELGMDEETFGTYLQWNRTKSGRGIHEIITDEDGNEMFVLTGQLHNPNADTVRDAQRKIEGLRQVLGDQGMQTLQQAAQVFYDNNFAIMELAYNTGIISEASWQLVNMNRDNYVTFRIGEYASRNLAPSVKKMYGTMKDIVDPVTATIQQMGAFTRFALNNRLNNMAVSALSLEGLVYQKNPQTPGFDTVSVMEGGRPKTYWVPRKYAYEMNKPTPSPITEGIARFNTLPIVMEIRKLFTAFRPDFYAPNAYRDFMRTLSNFTAASGVKKRALIKELPHAFKEAYRYVTGKGSAEIEEAMRQGAIPIHSELNDRTALIEREEVLQTYVELDHKSMFEKIPYAGRIFTALNKAGMASEMFSKLAAWNAAKKAGLSNTRAAYLVKSHAGTPDTSIRGSLAPVLNTVFMFNSVKMSAMREDFNLAMGKHGKEAQKRYAANQAILFAPRLAPSIMKWSVLALIAMGIKDEWLDEMKAAYDLEESVPASTRENNHVFIMGIGADGKIQTLTIPKTETQRQLEAIFNMFVSEELGAEVGLERGSFIRMVMGDGGGEDFLRNFKTAFTWGATDINVAPVLEVPLKWMALVGDPSKPPTDWFTGRPINNISPEEWSQMGGIARSAQMADWSLNKFGVVGDVKDMALLMSGYYNGDESKFLNAVPILNRFYRKYSVSDYKAIEEASAEIHKNSQEWSFTRGDNTRRAMSEIHRLSPLSDTQLEDIRSGLPRERHLLNGMNRWAYTPAQTLFKESTDPQQKEQIQTMLDARFDEFYRLLRKPKGEKEMLAKFPGAFSWTLNKLATKPDDAEWSVSAMRDTHLWKTIESSGMTGPQAFKILTDNYKVGKQSLQRLSALFGAAK
jgi:DNA-binding PadR family transcriptional regulator